MQAETETLIFRSPEGRGEKWVLIREKNPDKLYKEVNVKHDGKTIKVYIQTDMTMAFYRNYDFQVETAVREYYESIVNKADSDAVAVYNAKKNEDSNKSLIQTDGGGDQYTKVCDLQADKKTETLTFKFCRGPNKWVLTQKDDSNSYNEVDLTYDGKNIKVYMQSNPTLAYGDKGIESKRALYAVTEYYESIDNKPVAVYNAKKEEDSDQSLISIDSKDEAGNNLQADKKTETLIFRLATERGKKWVFMKEKANNKSYEEVNVTYDEKTIKVYIQLDMDRTCFSEYDFYAKEALREYYNNGHCDFVA